MSDALDLLFEDPDLADWIASFDVFEIYPDSAVVRAAAYVSPQIITGLNVGSRRNGEPIIEARVQGSRRAPYKVAIEFYDDDWDGWYLDEHCTCPVRNYCKHSAAVLLYLKKIISQLSPLGFPNKSRLPKDVRSWLAAVEKATTPTDEKPAKKPASNPKFLAYCLETARHDGSDPYLTLHSANYQKSGRINFESSVAQADPMRPAKYMSDEDLPIAQLYHQMLKKQQRWGRIQLDGPDASRLLGLALATGRLFWGHSDSLQRPPVDYQPLAAGEALHLSPAWSIDYFGKAKPVLNGLPNGFKLLRTSPPFFLDPENLRLGPVTSELSNELLELWQRGPEVPEEALEHLSERISAIPRTSLPAPVSFETEIRPPVPPSASLHIHRKATIIGGEPVNVLHALPTFHYGDSPAIPPAGHGENFLEYAILKDGKRIVWTRSPETEQQFLQDLERSGLIRIGQFITPGSLPRELDFSFVTKSTKPTPEMAWLVWLEGNEVQKLRESGWTIIVDPKAGLTAHDIGDFLPAIEAETDHGIDWFRFDVSFEIDGAKRSLIPLIAQAIQHNFPPATAADLPEWVFLPCDNADDGFIRLPAKRFLEIVDQVRHLFHGREPGIGPLKLDRLSAAGVADSLDLRSTDTIRTLANLGRALKDIRELPHEAVPESVKATLRPYQHEGFRWLRFLAKHGLNGILADDMGLGKTLQTLTHLAAEHAENPGHPSLVVAPTSVVPNWAAEAAKFTPSLKILILHGPDRLAAFEEIPKADLVITSFPLLHRDIELLSKQRWHSLILDEAQNIKNPKSITAKAACTLESDHRICLSGTPMENHLGELWSLMRFLMPGFLPDEKTFNSAIRKPIERERSGDAQTALNRRISPLILRRTKDQVATDLPPKTELIHHIELTRKQVDLYESVRASMDKRVRDAIAAKGLANSHIIVLDALLKLRQICCHPALLSIPAAKKVTESAKLDYLTEELLPQLLEEGRRILLFSQFTSMLALIEAHLVKENIPFLKLTGQTKDRATLVNRFQSGEVSIFLISLKAGGTGLNLTAADTVIHYDPWWNPAAENQATDRAHRIGQNKPVFVHKLVCRGSIEDRILELQNHKSALVKALLSEETTSLRINPETLSQLLAPIV